MPSTRMRHLAAGLLLTLAAGWGYAQPPGAIVIRPKGVPATDAGPEKPGFIVIRPQTPGTTNPKLVGTPSASGVAAPKVTTPVVAAPPAAPAPALAPNPEEGVIKLETWDVVYLRGIKAGFFHVTVREYERDGKKYLYAVKEQRLSVARSGTPAEVWGKDTTLETPEGAVLTTRMQQGIGRDQMMSVSGNVEGGKLAVTVEGMAGNSTNTVPFPDGVVGIAREATLFRDKKPKVGDKVEYLYYEGRVARAVKVRLTVEAAEDLTIYEGQKPRKTLRVEVVNEDPLPSATIWCDAATFEPLRMDSHMPTLGGKVTALRTSREFATQRPTRLPELNEVQSIPLDRAIAEVHRQAGATYRVQLGGHSPIEKAFAADARQTLKVVDAKARTFDLTVTPRRAPAADAAKADAPGKEFAGTSYFIDWDNEPTKALTRQALAGLPEAASDWQKAQAIERHVHKVMRGADFSQSMATCSNVAKTLTGDCTEYAMLAAGMCRAAGVPSRTALGLVYATDRQGKPILAYHMWFEAFAGGEWLPLDATLGLGSVGPGHLKITDASWDGVNSFAPLLPVLVVLGAEPKVTVGR